jgi:hypothetical protein
VHDTLADVNRSRDLLGFETSVSFQDGLSAEYEWVLERVRAGE